MTFALSGIEAVEEFEDFFPVFRSNPDAVFGEPVDDAVSDRQAGDFQMQRTVGIPVFDPA